MSQPSDPISPNSAAPATSEPRIESAGSPAAGETTPSPAASVSASVSSGAAASAEPSSSSLGSGSAGASAADGEDDGGEEEPHESAPHEGANVEGAPAAKRKRRRRRKKKPGTEGVVAGAEEASGSPAVEVPDGASTAEGGEARLEGTRSEGGGRDGNRGDRRGPKPPKRDRAERERPAFNVGDVVFGKVLEVTDDALFIDLSGKAKAIFDLRELLLTDEDVEAYTEADRREAAEIAAARAASAKGTPFKRDGVADAASVTAAGDLADSTENSAADADADGGTMNTAGQTADSFPEVAAAAAADSPANPESDAGTGSAGDSPVSAVTAEEQIQASPSELEERVQSASSAAGSAAESTDSADTTAKTSNTDHGTTAQAAEVTRRSVDEKAQPQLPRVIMEPGAPFVGLVHNDGGRGGLMVLTHHPKRAQKVKPVVGDAARSGALVFGLVTGTIKGGVEVDVDGLRAFAPASHVELRPGTDLSHLVGQRLSFAVTQYAKRGRDVVLSRRSMLESEAKEKRDKALGTLEIGAVVDGIVRTVVPFGAFVDVGGVEGLVPLSEMSHNRADQPKDLFKVGETARVKILRVDEKGKLWLSRRSAIEDPWASVAKKYATGTTHTGKIARLQPFGAFVELETGIDGLIHTADLSIKRIEHPEEVVKVGDDIEVIVAHVDPHAHRISLHPAPSGETANEEPQKVALSKIVKVVVVAAEAGGLVVRIRGATGRNARGFVSASATGTPRGTELRKLFPVGKELETKIVEMDPRRGELKLSIKAMTEENERNAYQQYRAQVKREAKFGTFADLLAKRNTTPTK